MSRFRIRVGVVTAAVALVLIAVGGVVYHLQVSDDLLRSDSVAGGPLQDFANEDALPGQITDFSAVVVNPGQADVVFLSAAVIPLPGYPVPRLVHLGLVPTAPVLGSTLQSDYGWPPSAVKVRPFAGASLSHGEVAVAFGISGDRSGADYAVAGLRILYRVEGHVHYLKAWSATVDCVSGGDLTSQQINACSSAADRVDAVTARMAGLISPLQYLHLKPT